MVGISNGRQASAVRATSECDGWARLAVAVGDLHTAESLCDSHDDEQERTSRLPLRDETATLEGWRGL
jgi:hypothetical protein